MQIHRRNVIGNRTFISVVQSIKFNYSHEKLCIGISYATDAIIYK